MPTTIDLEQRRISAGVGDLVGNGENRAIGLSGTGLSRMWIGQELHRRVQEELAEVEEGFRAEVVVHRTFEIDGWTLDLNGRADGVAYEDESPIRVDEIKTLHFAVDLNSLYIQERLDRYRDQLRLYARLFSVDAEPPAARLILVDIVTGDERMEKVPWSPNEVDAWLRQRLHRLVNAEKRRCDHLAGLRESADLVPFPHPEKRPAQETIGAAVAEALEDSRNLLVRAPTGCGKTAAVLHPAVQTAMRNGRRLFFLTAKTLQQKIAVESTQAMQGEFFRSLQLRAKSKMCAHNEVICHEEVCPYASEYGLKLVRTQLIENLLDENFHQAPDSVFAEARDHEVCPFEVSLDLMPSTDVVVCDYNYVFDPSIGLHALLHGGALNDAILIIDEAHNLVERSREYYSPALDTELLTRALAFLERRDNDVFQTLSCLVEHMEEFVRDAVARVLGNDKSATVETSFTEAELRDVRISLDGAMLRYFVYKRENEMWMANDPVLDVFLALTRFHRVLGLGGEEFVHLASRTNDGVEEIKILCLDASRFLAETLEASAGAVAMSATLEPFEFYRNLLGFDERTSDELFVPSPFPPENRLVLSINDVDTTWRQRGRYFDPIASWIARLAHPDKNVLVLFPSYAFLAAVHDRLPPSRHQLIVQQSGATDQDQYEVLERLSNGDSHLLFAVLGGIYAEGVDYPGSMLSQVIVVSPGLPPFNRERDLLKNYYQQHYGHGFSYAYLIPGLTRVVQAAGRLLRSDTDRGVITLMCRRFQDGRYARYLPTEWIGDGPETMLHEDPQGEVERFFG